MGYLLQVMGVGNCKLKFSLYHCPFDSPQTSETTYYFASLQLALGVQVGKSVFSISVHTWLWGPTQSVKKESFVRPVITSKISQHICKLIALSQTVTFQCFISENVSSCFFINVPIVFGCSFLFDWKCCLCRFGFVWRHPNGLSIDETKLLSTIRLPPNICESLSQTSSNQIF